MFASLPADEFHPGTLHALLLLPCFSLRCNKTLLNRFLACCSHAADEFHLGTLQALLGALPQLQPGVRVHTVLSLLMDRLAKWVHSLLFLLFFHACNLLVCFEAGSWACTACCPCWWTGRRN